jgi:hypothetical protein
MVNTGRKYEIEYYDENVTNKVGREVADRLLHKDSHDGCDILVSMVGSDDGRLAYIAGTDSCKGSFFLKNLEVVAKGEDTEIDEIEEVLEARQVVEA